MYEKSKEFNVKKFFFLNFVFLRLKDLPTNIQLVSSTENDEELAKALHAAMNGDASFNPEERSRILARKLANLDLR